MSSPAPTGMDTTEAEAKPRVLLVDDDEDFRKTAAAGLAARGFAVIQAASAEEALDLTARGEDDIDIAVLDVMLPDSWGPQVGFEQSFLRPTIKFLYISGYTREDTVLRASTENLPFLEKPFTISELAEAIHSVLEGEDGDGRERDGVASE